MQLDSPAQRTSSKLFVVALVHHVLTNIVADLETDVLLVQSNLHLLEQEVDDLAQAFTVERVEHHDLVNAVQKFRPERPLEAFHRLRSKLLVLRCRTQAETK